MWYKTESRGCLEKATILLHFQIIFSRCLTLIYIENTSCREDERMHFEGVSTLIFPVGPQTIQPWLWIYDPIRHINSVKWSHLPLGTIRLLASTINEDCPFAQSEVSHLLPQSKPQRTISWMAVLGNTLNFICLPATAAWLVTQDLQIY